MYIRDQKLRDARERPAPDQLREVRADERDGQRDRVPDREAHPREQVVDERVAEVALEQRELSIDRPIVVGERRAACGTRR